MITDESIYSITSKITTTRTKRLRTFEPQRRKQLPAISCP